MSHKPILQAGRNCWRICHADKVAFLINVEHYFDTIYNSLPLAEQQILILARDIYSQLRLVSENRKNENHQCSTLSPILKKIITQLLEQKPQLHINILTWDFTLLFTLSREWKIIYRMAWESHQRLKFNLDDHSPSGAAHNQKVVVIDDALAFAGGLDLSWRHWDRSNQEFNNTDHESLYENALPIKPYQEIQMVVAGQAAAALGSLARERWRRATGEKLPLPQTPDRSLWPQQLKVDIENVNVAIVRSQPAYDEYTEVREVEQLYLDTIAAARDYIYIENPFFSAASISDALKKRLLEKDGPEVILNLALSRDDLLSQQALNLIRPDLLQSLSEADKHKHLAVYYPYKPEANEQSVELHARVIIMDERFVRIGSASLNKRSMSVDTECDLAIEAAVDNSRVQAAIGHIRNNLLAEHLNCTTDEVDQQINQQTSIIQCIERLRSKGRSLRPFHTHLAATD